MKKTPPITVYTKPECIQCDATKRELMRRGITYNTVDLTKSAEALEKVKQLGYRQTPVVVTPTDHWSGFRPDKLKALDPNGTVSASLDGPARRSGIKP